MTGALVLTGACTPDDTGSPAPTAQPSPSSSTAATSSPSASDAPVTLRFAVYGDTSQLTAYRRMARAYEQQNPTVTVQVETARDEAAATRRLERQLDAQPAPDVFLADSDKVPELVADDRVQPVDELLEDRGVQFGDAYERLGLEAFAGESALQCMPNDVSPYVVFYNERLVDLSAAVQPGETVPDPAVTGWVWRQFALAAQSASQEGVQGVYLPPELTTLTPLLRSNGGNIVDDDQNPTTLTLESSPSREALEAILSLARDSRVNPTPEQLAREDAVTRFVKGRLAMMIGTRAMLPRLRQASGLVFDVYPLPSFGRLQTVADVTGYCISRTSEHVDAAADFLAFASGDRGARITARSGGIVPANLSALASPAFQQPELPPDNVGVFTDFIRQAETMPNSLGWPQVVRRTRPLIAALFYDTVLDLDVQLAQIDALSKQLLAEPSASASPGA
jgi:multiple sugar transport system substrate-binding protein